MSYAEAPEITVTRFIHTPAWESEIDERSLAAQLISVSKETNREPDYCHFEVQNRILIDPVTQRSILPEIKRGTNLQEIEYQVAVQIQDWAVKNESGIAIWVSPRNNIYPCEKISIHKIAYTWDGTKVIQNSYILFDAVFRNPEELRKFIFTEKDTEKSIPEILTWIEQASKKTLNTNSSNYKETAKTAMYFAQRIRSGIPPETITREMREAGFLGQNPISCPGKSTTFSNLLESRSSISIFSSTEGWHSGICRICHAPTLVGPCSICSPCEKKF
ncbi:MAG: hypothetical protein ABIJ85_03235 [bacterium]